MIHFDARTLWILIAWLTPFWWGLALLVLASLADRFPWWRGFVSRLFERLGQTPAVY